MKDVTIMMLNGEEVRIDSMCAPLINLFNKNGFKTQFCCEGHEVYESFSIIFDDSVTDKDIERLDLCLNHVCAYYELNDEKYYPNFYPFHKWNRHYYDFLNNKEEGLYHVYLQNWELLLEPGVFMNHIFKGKRLSKKEIVDIMYNELVEAFAVYNKLINLQNDIVKAFEKHSKEDTNLK